MGRRRRSEGSLAATRAAGQARDHTAALQHAREALDLLRGGFLVGQEDGWVESARTDTAELEIEALEWSARSGLALGGAELPGAQRAARELVTRAPFREAGHGVLMEVIAATGNVAEALQVYDELRVLLRDELDVAPSADVQALHKRLLDGNPTVRGDRPSQPRPSPFRPVVPSPPPSAKTRYARNGDIALAYQVIGDGPTTLLLVTGWVLPMETIWEDPAYARFVERLARSFRVVLWDKRGTGLSDRVAVDQIPTLEERMDDMRAVLDAAEAEKAAIVGMSEGGVLAALFGASHPGRTGSLVIYGSWGRTIGDDANRGMTDRAGFDIGDVVSAIHAPTLVIHRAGDKLIGVDNGRWLADHIPGAEYVELAGDDHLWWLGDQDGLLDEIERFLVGAPPAREPDRVLATVLFAEIVDAGGRAAELGERRWRDLMTHHDAIVRDRLAQFRGRAVKSTSDGLMATFDGPARAIRCAGAIRDALLPLGIELRAGVHTGEVEVAGDDVHGVSVGMAARVASTAAPGEVLVSRTVRDLVAGSGIALAGRGAHTLKGADEQWQLYAALAPESIRR